jgi:hypothetical protein
MKRMGTAPKVDLPHLLNDTVRHAVSDPRIGRWIAGVLGVRFIQLWACELT